MMEREGSFKGMEVRDVALFDSCNVVPKVKSRVRRREFFFCLFPVCFVVFLCHLDLHQILGENLAD